jgi:NADPH-dependent ferric siderophore reductase
MDMQVFHATVVETIDLGPAMRRIVFGGPGLAGFTSTGVGDEYIRLLFPPEPDQVPDLPPIVNGGIDYSAIDLDRLRTYTVRDHDPVAGTLTIDFVVHEGGVAATWARQAKPGQVIVVNSPDGLYDPPPGLQWLILVADYAGLPAAARLAETVPDHVRTRLVVEIADELHRLPIRPRPNLEVTWLLGGNGVGPSRLEEVVRMLPRPDGVGYLWVAGESRTLRGVRRYLRKELGLPATAYKTVGYWIEKAEQWRQRYQALDAQTRGALEALWSSGRDEQEIEDEYHEQLTRLGL